MAFFSVCDLDDSVFMASAGGGRDSTSSNGANNVELCGLGV